VKKNFFLNPTKLLQTLLFIKKELIVANLTVDQKRVNQKRIFFPILER